MPRRNLPNTMAGRLTAWRMLGVILPTSAEARAALGRTQAHGGTYTSGTHNGGARFTVSGFLPSDLRNNLRMRTIPLRNVADRERVSAALTLVQQAPPDAIVPRTGHFTIPADAVRVVGPLVPDAPAGLERVVLTPEERQALEARHRPLVPEPPSLTPTDPAFPAAEGGYRVTGVAVGDAGLTPDEARERLQAVADATRPVQMSLLPEARLEGALMQVPVNAIRSRPRVADQAFVDSVGRWGVLQPVALVDRGAQHSPRYQMAAGRRRLQAAQLNGMSTIPALVFPAGTPLRHAASIALMENAMRSENPLVDLAAIEALLREGATMAQITDELGIDQRTVRLRLRLADLSDHLRITLESGNMAHSVALAAARLTPTEQHALYARVTPTHPRLTMADVREVGGSRYEQQIRLLEEAEDAAQRTNFAQVRISRLAGSNSGGYTFTFGDDHGPMVRTIVAARAQFGFLPLAVVPGQRVPEATITFGGAHPAIRLSDGQEFMADRVMLRNRGADLGESTQFTGAMQIGGGIQPVVHTTPVRAPVRGEVTGPSDDAELTPEQEAQVAAEMQRTQMDAGEDTWERVVHLLTLASACVPAAPDNAVEQVWAEIEVATASAMAMRRATPAGA